MTKKLAALGLVAAVLTFGPAVPAPAHALTGLKEGKVSTSSAVTEVGRRGGHYRGGHFRRGPAFYRGRGFRNRGFRFGGFYGYPYYYSGYGYGYGGCNWLRVRAIRTGSPYWWRRYEDCIY